MSDVKSWPSVRGSESLLSMVHREVHEDAQSGKALWNYPVPAVLGKQPVVEGYMEGGQGSFHCGVHSVHGR